MIRCRRCGMSTPMVHRDQTRCPQCEREVAAIVAVDSRRTARRWYAKDLTGAAA